MINIEKIFGKMALDASRLDTLFEDDWKNLYKPLEIVDTNLYSDGDESSTVSNINNKLDEILTRQDVMEEKLNKIDVSVDLSEVANLESQLKDISTNVSVITKNQEEVVNFLNTFNQWENINGEKI